MRMPSLLKPLFLAAALVAAFIAPVRALEWREGI